MNTEFCFAHARQYDMSLPFRHSSGALYNTEQNTS